MVARLALAATIGGGFISLRLLQVVQITMSVAIPLADFDSVEQNKFVNNVATLLQIPASRIKIVSVQSKAQVAAQGGRLLQVVEAVEIEVEDAGRNLQDEGVEVIFQVIEDETVSGGTGGPGADEFSGAAILELQSLIETLLNASETGTLSSFLGFNVVLESVELTDVPTDATDNTAGNSTVTQTTVTTTFTSTATTSTSTTDPNSTTEATEEPIEDPTGALVQSILIGAVVGIGVGVLMMIIGYLVRRRMYSRNVHASYSEGQQEALNP